MKYQILISVGLLMLSGCGVVGPYEIRGEEMLTLDGALSLAREGPQYGYLADLWALWSQAPTKDKIIIEEEILNASFRDQYGYGLTALEKLSKVTLSDEIRSSAENALLKYEQAQEEEAKRKREEDEEKKVQEQKELEETRLVFRVNRERILRIGAGNLHDKSAEEVRKLVNDWNHEENRWKLNDRDLEEFFNLNIFHKTFGEPQRKQFFSGDFYFYYECKDGMVQVQVSAARLEKNLVFIDEFSIF